MNPNTIDLCQRMPTVMQLKSCGAASNLEGKSGNPLPLGKFLTADERGLTLTDYTTDAKILCDWIPERIKQHINDRLGVVPAKAEFAKSPKSRCDRAFQTVLKNRTAHGGILGEGAGVLKNGENGKGILSRWYPQTIAKRITNIEFIADRLEFIHGDAFDVLARFQKEREAVFFIDPPYTAGGKRAGSRLYTHSEIDHEHLFSVCEKLRGDFLMTYDNAEEVRALAEQHGFETKPVTMKNTHHAEMDELLIGRNLDWVQDGGIFREEAPSYKVSSAAKKPRRSK
jgi:DNA adenine methylase